MPHRIAREIDVQEFVDLILGLNIVITSHALFRLHEKQRKIYKEYLLHDVLKTQVPVRVGIQRNGNYVAFYKRGKDTLRVVLDIRHDKAKVVTFYIT